MASTITTRLAIPKPSYRIFTNRCSFQQRYQPFESITHCSLAQLPDPQPGSSLSLSSPEQQEPFDWLYFIPALTIISNLDDGSYSISPELSDTDSDDLELRFKVIWLQGDPLTEFSEKSNDRKLEVRLRYY